MDEYGDDRNRNDAVDTSGRSSGGGDSNASDTVRGLVDLHAFILGLVGNGTAAGDANPNRPGNLANANTPAGQGRSVRAMAEGNPEMKQLMDIVVGTLKRRLKCVTFFRQLLSRSMTEEKAKRVAAREDPSMQAVVNSGAVRDLVAIMGRNDAEEDSEDAAWALIHLVDAGTKWHIQHAIDMGALPKFVVLLDSSNVEIRKETARVLTKMSQDVNETWRDPLWDSGTIDALITVLQQEYNADVLKYSASAVAAVCRNEPDDDRIHSVAPTLAQLLYYHDETVMEKACFALNACMKCSAETVPPRVQTILRMGVCRRLVELLQHPSCDVQFPALCCVACILEGDEDRQKKSILKHRPLPILQDLLSAEDNAIIVYACEAIASILALGQNQIQAVIQHQIFPPLIELLAWDNAFISDEVVKAFRAAVSNGTPDQIRVLVGNGCIGPLCGLLDGDYPDTVLETLKVLGKILHAGANHNGMNPMAAEVVEQGEIAKLRALRRHDNPGIQAGAAAILRTFFGFEEESESGSESDESGKLDEDNGDEVESVAESESDADEIEDGDDAEPPRQRPRIA